MKGTRGRRWAAASAALSAAIAGLVLLRSSAANTVVPPAASGVPTGMGFVAAAPRLPGAPVSAIVPPPAPAKTAGANSSALLAAGGQTLDLAELRRSLPENLYWTLGVPTNDPSVLREREEQQRLWDKTYGRILSGTAAEEEIVDYYAFRRRLSDDYRTLSLQILAGQDDTLSERDRGLHEMNVRMHTQRLEELPQRQQSAFERKRRQDALRGAWERAGRPRPTD